MASDFNKKVVKDTNTICICCTWFYLIKSVHLKSWFYHLAVYLSFIFQSHVVFFQSDSIRSEISVHWELHPNRQGSTHIEWNGNERDCSLMFAVFLRKCAVELFLNPRVINAFHFTFAQCGWAQIVLTNLPRWDSSLHAILSQDMNWKFQ